LPYELLDQLTVDNKAANPANVAAGKTPVGAKIKARLAVATLIDGKVIPRSAVFSGEVIDSAAKTATDPSRLAIRMDSVVWKKGSASLTAYLTAWYYPLEDRAGRVCNMGQRNPRTGPGTARDNTQIRIQGFTNHSRERFGQ
jgi:hypothetical protein